MYPDEFIDYWGRIFTRNDLFNQRGIRFETFLRDPQAVLDAVALAPRMEPLLPAQDAVMCSDIEELLMNQVGAQVRGGVYVLPLKHHAYTVSLTRHHNRRMPT